jgi:hypothetical protein
MVPAQNKGTCDKGPKAKCQFFPKQSVRSQAITVVRYSATNNRFRFQANEFEISRILGSMRSTFAPIFERTYVIFKKIKGGL